MAEENKKKGNQINIELSEEISEGTYSNLAIRFCAHCTECTESKSEIKNHT